jgi:hypothetical protein
MSTKKEQPSEPPGATATRQSLQTPHRPVISVALLLFVPVLWLVMDGNLSVQTALIRFVAALLVSWVAAWLVFATVGVYARTSGAAGAAGQPPASSPASADPAHPADPGRAEPVTPTRGP